MKDQTRNINPIAPALIAMTWWGTRYAAQRGGCMDFWDSLSENEQRTCRELAEQVKAAPMYEGEPREMERLRKALENFADEANWSDRPGCLQWMGKRHAIEFAQSTLAKQTEHEG